MKMTITKIWGPVGGLGLGVVINRPIIVSNPKMRTDAERVWYLQVDLIAWRFTFSFRKPYYEKVEQKGKTYIVGGDGVRRKVSDARKRA